MNCVNENIDTERSWSTAFPPGRKVECAKGIVKVKSQSSIDKRFFVHGMLVLCYECV